ncbi:Na(+)-translocating NADH-quinone reductase subunit B [uncultured Roseburia sp.]|uniref:Ion-translocating oxidoreductase complex subunit D n=1 Tax=Brotonthovivens ammoniilytica TaxID=2981725 RepID=A0ABT2TGK9_9FIRM|nr:RnfABCDGE type electron transport complex subunit D [Brotonthovivens ammoniilytica]MCU6761333.1 RnfABCDGE type electron transport complex subunit D [Brotonthovivens ammoniilytica]SCI25520.1 Na(+)-translocating NADH-quinone reductase subunit B [uncultured Roseburia sp.]
MSDLYNVASSPHIRSKASTSRIMLYVIIALLPATVFGIYNFGPRALGIIVVTIASCMVSEWVFNKIRHKKQTIGDLSCVVTGLLLALNLSHTIPYWMAIVGGGFAIVVVKMLFGGLGQNFMNPALGARCFLLLAFTGPMTSFTFDGATGATPLAIIKGGELYSDSMAMLTGRIAGTIGETSVIALLIGAIFLILMGVIDLRIPGTYILTFAVFIILFGGHLTSGDLVPFVVQEICGGGLILGAFFMATDYVTSPITPRGKILYGIICGCLLGIFRMFGASAEGCSYSIIFANVLVPLIERVTIPKPFGKGGEK